MVFSVVVEGKECGELYVGSFCELVLEMVYVIFVSVLLVSFLLYGYIEV